MSTPPPPKPKVHIVTRGVRRFIVVAINQEAAERQFNAIR
jgi:hypothetical protein